MVDEQGPTAAGAGSRGRRAARFKEADVSRAFKGAADAGIAVAVFIQPDGSIAIVPADRLKVSVVASDLDDRIAAFGAS